MIFTAHTQSVREGNVFSLSANSGGSPFWDWTAPPLNQAWHWTGTPHQIWHQTGTPSPPPPPPGLGLSRGPPLGTGSEPGSGTGSEPRSDPGVAPEVESEVNPEAGGMGGTPIAVTQADCLVCTLKLQTSICHTLS